MGFLAIFYAPMALVLAQPAAPFIFSALLALAQCALLLRHRQRPTMLLWRRPALFAAAIWTVYGLYELQVQATMPTANIRIDLLVLAPILYVFSAVALWWILREWQSGTSNPDAESGPTTPAATESDLSNDKSEK